MLSDEHGYVIRCVDLECSGRVVYRGARESYCHVKDAFPLSETYTLSAAKRAISNLRKKWIGYDFCIERLSSYYHTYDESQPKDTRIAEIDAALNRLDELWNGNDFDNGDKMRINEVRRTLKNLKERILNEEKT